MYSHRVFHRLIEFHDLPTLPQAVVTLLEATEGGPFSPDEMMALLETDQAISVCVLDIANSRYYGAHDEMDSIRRAVMVLGFDAVYQLTLAASVFKAFLSQHQFTLEPQDFWMHAFGTAKAAQLLCKGPVTLPSPEACFTAGLLHDMGRYLLALVLRNEYRAVLSQATDQKMPLHECEKKRLGVNHAEVGRWLTAKWRFPALIVEIIGNIHRPATAKGKYAEEIAVVQLAETLARQAGFGDAGDWKAPAISGLQLEFLGLTPRQVEDLLKVLEEIRVAARKLLKRLRAR